MVDRVAGAANWFFKKCGVNLVHKEQRVINFHFLWWVLGRRYTLYQAALFLRMSINSLIDACGKVGISSWPYRQFKSFSLIYNSGLASPTDKAFIRRVVLTSMRHRFKFSPRMNRELLAVRQMVYRNAKNYHPVRRQRYDLFVNQRRHYPQEQKK